MTLNIVEQFLIRKDILAFQMKFQQIAIEAFRYFFILYKRHYIKLIPYLLSIQLFDTNFRYVSVPILHYTIQFESFIKITNVISLHVPQRTYNQNLEISKLYHCFMAWVHLD